MKKLPKPNFLDKAIAIFSPKAAVHRLKLRSVYGDYLAGIGHSPELPWSPRPVDDFSKIVTDSNRLEIIGISNRLYLQFGEVRNMVKSIANLSTCNAFIPQFVGTDKDFGTAAESYWWNWGKDGRVCDASGTHNFERILFQISQLIDIDGEAFVVLNSTPTGFPMVKLFRSRECKSDEPDNNGITYDKFGRPNWYYFATVNSEGKESFQAVPSSSVIHFWSPDFPDQKRGLSSLVHCIEPFLRIEQLRKDESIAVALASSIGLIKRTATGEAEDGVNFDDADNVTDGTKTLSYEDIRRGSINYIGEGEEFINFNSGARPADGWHKFIEHLLRSACSGLRYPYELVVKSDSLSAEVRVGNIMLERTIKQRQAELTSGVQRIWNFVITSGIQAGSIPEPTDGDFYSTDWSSGRRLSIDFGRDIAAELSALQAGTTTYREIYQSRGLDEVEQLTRWADEQALIKQLLTERGLNSEDVKKASESMKQLAANNQAAQDQTEGQETKR